MADHCNDRTESIVEEYAARRPNIRLLRNEARKGSFSNAVITGYNAATGNLIVTVMADHCDDAATINAMAAKMDDGFDV
ncbi:MAG: glycosyltransferase, partial [Actinomycetales bacterium]